MHLSRWEIKQRIFFTSWLQQSDFSSGYLWGFIPTGFYSCSLPPAPPKKRYWNKEIILQSDSLHRAAFMALIQIPKDCSPVQTHRKGCPNDITSCFLAVQTQFIGPDAEKSEAEAGSEDSDTSVLHWLHFQPALLPYSLTDVIQIFHLPFWLITSKIQLTIWGWLDTNIKNSNNN